MSTPDLDGAVRVDAFDPDGETSTDPAVLAAGGTDPFIFAFEPGDVIDLIPRVEAHGYVEAIDGNRLRVVRPLEFLLAPDGVFVREPGGDFAMVRGEIGASFSMSKSRRRNELTVSIAIDERD